MSSEKLSPQEVSRVSAALALNAEQQERILEEGRDHARAGPTIKDSGTRKTWDTGSQRDARTGKGRFDLLPMWALERVAKLFEAGCLKYGDRNWEKGQPTNVYADSAMRHLCRYIRGERDEDHLNAAAWNLLCLMETEKRVELGILPKPLLTLPKSLDEQIEEAGAKFLAAPAGEKNLGTILKEALSPVKTVPVEDEIPF